MANITRDHPTGLTPQSLFNQDSTPVYSAGAWSFKNAGGTVNFSVSSAGDVAVGGPAGVEIKTLSSVIGAIRLRNNQADAGSRDWMLRTGLAAYGDFAITVSTAKNGDPSSSAIAAANCTLAGAWKWGVLDSSGLVHSFTGYNVDVSIGQQGLGNGNQRQTLYFGKGSTATETGFAAPGAFHVNSNGDKIVFYDNNIDTDIRIGFGLVDGLWIKSQSSAITNAFSIFATGTATGTAPKVFNVSTAGAVTFGTGSTAANHLIQGNYGDNRGILDVFNNSTVAAAPACRMATQSPLDDTSNKLINFLRVANAAGAIVCNGAGGATFGAYSDARLKENFKRAEPQLPKICALNIQNYDFIEGSKDCLGVTAQEMQTVYPECVSADELSEEKYLQVAGWGPTEYKLAKCIQELHAELQQLRSEIATLKGA